MEMNINLNLKTKQELVMTPNLQMAIDILQYNNLELEEFINEKAKENPLLEMMENRSDKYYNQANFTNAEKDSYDYENFIAYKPHFCESIESQLFEILDDQEIELGKFIVGNLNHSGELNIEIEELAQLFFDSNTEAKIEKTRDIYNKIQQLNLDEALDSVNPCAEYVKADLIVKRNENGFEIISNESSTFDLNISSYYLEILKNSKDPKVEEYLKEKYKSALWLIKSIKQRKETVNKILKAVIDKQRDFFEYGLKHLRKLTMQEIAEEIEMHESTVSRATTAKYIQTPHGTLPFKMFFSTGIGNFSSVSIKAIIFELIKSEDKSSPLSDSKIAEFLNKEYEFNISRRTVAKYRKSLAIKGSRARKIR